MTTNRIRLAGFAGFALLAATACGSGASAPGNDTMDPGADVLDAIGEVPADGWVQDSTDRDVAGDTGADTDADGGHDAGQDGDVPAPAIPYPIVDTAQAACYGVATCMACPAEGQAFFGQDAQYAGARPVYQDNQDGTVTDRVTGLTWQKDPGAKQSYANAIAGVTAFTLAGHNDWRVPTIKELYSLIRFTGLDPSGYSGTDTSGLVPFLDADTFVFHYGDTSAGQRIIDSQWVTSSVYTSTVMNGQQCFFGVNFADGRIKCYPTSGGGRSTAGYYAIYVRGPTGYGVNDFAANGDGTVSDRATGLTWQQADSGAGMDWQGALAQCAGLTLGGHDDWRLPNAKELQSLVDYSRSPDKTASAAIDPVFTSSGITNEAGQPDWPCYWTSTTHANGTSGQEGANAAYVAFGRAMGYMSGVWMDVHGAGAQRSDPKTGNPADWPTGHGPQGDAIRILNHVRCVRGGSVTFAPDAGATCTTTPPPETCGNNTCDAGEETTCPADCPTTGPTACAVQSDCSAVGACPQDALKGCTCSADPQGTKRCIPACSADTDCPKPPNATLACSPQGLCVPQG